MSDVSMVTQPMTFVSIAVPIPPVLPTAPPPTSADGPGLEISYVRSWCGAGNMGVFGRVEAIDDREHLVTESVGASLVSFFLFFKSRFLLS